MNVPHGSDSIISWFHQTLQSKILFTSLNNTGLDLIKLKPKLKWMVNFSESLSHHV